MKRVLVFSAVALISLPAYLAVAPAFAQHGVSLGNAPSVGNGGGGFAAPNAYGYAGSYTGGAGYSSNFGFNTMRPGNMPSVPFYGGGSTAHRMVIRRLALHSLMAPPDKPFTP